MDIHHDELNQSSQWPDFDFPFQPYDIQVQFMRTLYTVLQDRKIGIFESPTGTGKSLSLICGAITWLNDFNRNIEGRIESRLEKQQVTAISQDKDELSWITEYDQQKADRERLQIVQSMKQKLLDRQSRLKNIKKNFSTVKTKADQRSTIEYEDKSNSGSTEDLDDEDLLIYDYHTDEEEETKLDNGASEEEEDGKIADDDPEITKIYYCSRTHSQLAQFIGEVKKCNFADSIRLVVLGSRQNLCINPSVVKLKSVNKINDKCLEMQKRKKEEKVTVAHKDSNKKRKISKLSGCPYLNIASRNDLRDYILADIHDIEEVVHFGTSLKACPYYGARAALSQADIVVTPYNTLLSKSTRDACGIKLAGNVVIVDEAHNLLETIGNINSVELSHRQLTEAMHLLQCYQDRYKKRLSARNLVFIKQLIYLLKCIVGIFTNTNNKTSPEKETSVYRSNDFLLSLNVDNLNLFKILRYCKRTSISKKLNGFMERYKSTVQVSTRSESTEHGENDSIYDSYMAAFQNIENFLELLTNPNQDGRVVVNHQAMQSQSTVKYLLLNPASYFAEIINDCRAVIIAGGTMQPVNDLRHRLFFACGVESSRITEFTCGHVIAPDRILPFSLSKGPSGLELDFSFQSRELNTMIDEFGRILLNFVNVIPGGMVCFFASYDYETIVYTRLEKTGILEKIGRKKKVYREPRKSAKVEQVLSDYARCIQLSDKKLGSTSLNGAVLFSVVGGKMSEGINFSDGLGRLCILIIIIINTTQLFLRCVIMVGLPYPNSKSPELIEKMEYLDSLSSVSSPDSSKTLGQMYYENICLKAVNQSIGRAIRHINDYAAIVLLDYRYKRSSIRSGLASWINERLIEYDRFGAAFASTRKFFADRQSSS
ncbi:putative ATP-dependent DNA helicase DDX11 [Trichoplax sp. H2]|nr:putative ATP-dependent DNA helicase DDX11 [Trichoplax sp. H2]|eukprot:RDD45928.1 putative ATP-dependent DNA helicase DDX11 [Trichoplax sp. H2]